LSYREGTRFLAKLRHPEYRLQIACLSVPLFWLRL